jgi:hypothetical protein
MASRTIKKSKTSENETVATPADEPGTVANTQAEGDQVKPPVPNAATFKKPVIVFNERDEVRVFASDFREALGSNDERFLPELLKQVIHASSTGQKLDKATSGFAFSVIEGIKPRDEIEAMLAAQMAAVHVATMTFARRLNRVETIPQQDSAEKTFNKLARTFAMQMDALKKYRSSGEQRITVQHVTVNDGGQAVVGTINHGGKTEGTEGGADE